MRWRFRDTQAGQLLGMRHSRAGQIEDALRTVTDGLDLLARIEQHALRARLVRPAPISPNSDSVAVFLDGDAIIKEYPDGTRESLGSITNHPTGDGDEPGTTS